MVALQKKKKKKKCIWVGIQHVRDYQSTRKKLVGLRRSRVCILSYSTTVDMTDYLFIFYLYFFFVWLYFVLFFLHCIFSFLFEDTIEKFRLLHFKNLHATLPWNLTRNLPKIYPKLYPDSFLARSLFIKLGTWIDAPPGVDGLGLLIMLFLHSLSHKIS